MRRVEWKPSLFVLFAREADSSEEGNWLIYQSESWNLPAISDARCEVILRHPQKFVSFLVGKFRRVFVIRFQTTCRGDIIKSQLLFVFVFPNGSVRIRRDTGHEIPTLFSVEPEQCLGMSASHTLAFLKEELVRKGSTARFARLWLDYDLDVRASYVLHLRGGTWKQLRRLLRCALVCCVEPDEQTAGFLWANWLDLNEGKKTYFSVIWNSAREPETIPTPPLLERWRQELLRHFAPVPQEDVQSRRTTPACWSQDGGKDELNELFFDGDESRHMSQHERLEAALELRDWARGKVPDELLRTLL